MRFKQPFIRSVLIAILSATTVGCATVRTVRPIAGSASSALAGFKGIEMIDFPSPGDDPAQLVAGPVDRDDAISRGRVASKHQSVRAQRGNSVSAKAALWIGLAIVAVALLVQAALY